MSETNKRSLEHAETGAQGAEAKQLYEAPRILSVEPLEAVASTCDGGGGYGKTVPPCSPGRLGS